MLSDETPRFGFGANWNKFNTSLTEDQRTGARDSLVACLGDITGLSFLDIGAGSGLFSDAAHALGASVRSFDFDPAHPGIERGDVLDPTFIASLGEYDIVYAWGVLHHTGRMWDAIENAASRVKPGGRFFISIYNDQGRVSERWRLVKRTYNRLPGLMRTPFVVTAMAPREIRSAVWRTIRGRSYLELWRNYPRGMSRWRDMVDWVGGYPFEVAKPEEVFAFLRDRGFNLEYLRTVGGGLGCNEFVFRRKVDKGESG
jgi:2-polyprenyl-6-hydroxyphenyl methylase/3-demethylubiquinone-9 3-methyltransferase